MKKILVFLIFFLVNHNYVQAEANQINIAYGGFSFGSNLPKNTISEKLQQTTFIDNNLRAASKQIQNKSFQLLFDPAKINQIKTEDAENQIVMLLALDDESFYNTSFDTQQIVNTKMYNLDLYLTFRIIFFNSYNNTLVASLPLALKTNDKKITVPFNEKEKLIAFMHKAR